MTEKIKWTMEEILDLIYEQLTDFEIDRLIEILSRREKKQ